MHSPEVKIKICGITNVDDALAALEAGADALGFVFYERSPRNVSVAQAAEIIARLPSIATVGVFVNPLSEAVGAAVAGGINTLQFHGDETPAFLRDLKIDRLQAARPLDRVFPSRHAVRSMKAFRIRNERSVEALPAFETDLWLLDSYVPGNPGGTGARFNWDLAVRAKDFVRPFLLAGGLTPDNAAEAVCKVGPFGVDVSSGVEQSAGRKDHARIRAFVQAVRAASV